MHNKNLIEGKSPKRNTKKGYVFAVGRRRAAIARVRLYTDGQATWGETQLKKGEIVVNKKPIDEYFSTEAAKALYKEPLRVTNTIGKYTMTIRVEGGGINGQLEAVVHGISRALAFVDAEKFRSILKKKGFLTRDPRVRERRKVGTGGKARRKKQSPKR